jgi:hypothetical protein
MMTNCFTLNPIGAARSKAESGATEQKCAERSFFKHTAYSPSIKNCYCHYPLLLISPATLYKLEQILLPI